MENYKSNNIESEKLKSLIEMIKKQMSKDNLSPTDQIKNDDTLVFSGDLAFKRNIPSAYNGMQNFLEKSKEYFKNLNWEVNGEGISAELVNPIGKINKIIVCITKDI